MTNIRLGHVRRGFAWLFILATLSILAVAVLLPRVGGATPYTVLSSSMEPDLPPGTLVVVKPTPAEQIGVGSVITYQLNSGKSSVVTHRVVSQTIDGQGQTRFQTQGDANSAADQEWVRPAQVRGELWYSVPFLGYVNNLLTGQQRQWAVCAMAVLLLGYAALSWGGALRDRTRARRKRAEVTDGAIHAPTPA